MTASKSVQSCRFSDLGDLTQALEQEFIISRGRNIELGIRYPALLDAENAATSYYFEENNQLIAHLCVLPTSYLDGGLEYKLGQVGLVYTAPECRGQGLAKSLLAHVRQSCEKQGMDAGILFTGKHTVYEGAGWLNHPVDCFYEWERKKSSASGEDDGNGEGLNSDDSKNEELSLEVSPAASLAAKDVVEKILDKNSGVVRRSSAFATIPIPSEKCQILSVREGNTQAYVLFGTEKNKAIIYEFHGSLDAQSIAWKYLKKSFEKIWLNSFVGEESLFAKDLQNLNRSNESATMILPISDRIKKSIGSLQLKIPYIDRV